MARFDETASLLSARPFAIGTPHGPDAPWRALTEAGHAALAREDSTAASEFYELALCEADRLLACAEQDAAALLLAPMTLTISLSNLAEVRHRAGDHAGAVGLKRRAVERLLEIAADDETGATLRLNCVRHLDHALAFLAEAAALDPLRKTELVALTSEALHVMRRTFDHLQSLFGVDGHSTPESIQPVRH